MGPFGLCDCLGYFAGSCEEGTFYPSQGLPCLDQLSGLRQLAEEVIHGAQHFCFVGTEHIVTCIRQTDDRS